MGWSLRYTSHLGYEPPAVRPQFLETVGSSEYAAHVHFAAEIGMAGVLYPWATSRPDSEVASVREALANANLKCSCVVCMPFELIISPIWSDRSASTRRRLAAEISRSAKIAASLQSNILAAIITADPERSPDVQMADVAANLREVAPIARDHGVVIGIEQMDALPGLLLRSTKQTLELIGTVDDSDVGIIFDTGHIHVMEAEILGPFRMAFEHVRLLQLADQPGRVEPGAGTLNLLDVAVHALERGYTGLVDLEHGWKSLTRTGEAEGLARLRHFDENVRLKLGGQPAPPKQGHAD